MTIERHWTLVPSEPAGTGVHMTPLGPPPGRYGGGEPGLQPGRIGAFLRRRAWTLVLGFVGVMTGVTAVTFLLPERYESTASFLVEQERSTGTDIPSLDVLQRLGQLASRETEVTLVSSRRVLEPVVDEGDLHVSVETSEGPQRPREVFASFDAGRDAVPGTYEIARDARGTMFAVAEESGDTLASAVAGAPLVFASMSVGPFLTLRPGGAQDTRVELEVMPFAQAVSETQRRIEVAPVQRDADLVSLTCSAGTAEEARWLCASMSDSYLSMRSELQHQEASAAADFLSGQAEEVKGRLGAAEDSLRLFTERTRAVALDTRADEEVRQNADIWAEREQLVAERDALEALTRQIESDSTRGAEKYRDFASFPTFLKNQNQVVTRLVEGLVELDNRRNDMAVHRTEQDAELAALDQRIRDVENQIRSIAVRYAQALTAQIGSLEETLVKSNYALVKIPAQQIETARLRRQVSILEDLYKFLQSRLQEAQIAQAVELPSVRVVDEASLPFKPSSPNVPLNLGLGFLLASSFGLMLALWREYSDTRIRERSTLAYETGIPVLGMLPTLKRPGPVIPLEHGLSASPHPVARAAPRSAERELALEAFRTLSAELGYVGRDLSDGGIRCVAVTSSTRGEGKTFTAANLAIARASHGARTLLVDADLRGKGLTRFLQMPAGLPGLTEMLLSGNGMHEEIHTLKIEGEGTLFVMPAGAGSSRSAALLESERFADFLTRAKERFDLVVVDTPPLNLVTDAAAVSSVVDAVVVVVRRGVTDREGLAFTLERVERAGGKTAGIVFNDALIPERYGSYSHAE